MPNLLPVGVLNAVRPFLLGWANGGLPSVPIAYPAHHDQFINTDRDCFLEYISGIHVSDPDDSFPQLDNFTRMTEVLQAVDYNSNSNRNLSQSMRAMFAKMQEGRSNIKYFAYHMNILCRKLALCSFVFPLKSSTRSNILRIQDQIMPAEFVSLLFLAQWESLTLTTDVIPMVKWGWYTHWGLSDLVTNYHYYKSIMDTKYYKKREILDTAFAGLRFKLPFLDKVKKNILDNISDFVFPPSNFVPQQFFDRIKLVDNFIGKYQKYLGFSDKFFYTWDHNKIINDKFDPLWIARKGAVINKKYDRDRMLREIQSQEFYNNMQDSIGKMENVEFDMPVRVNLIEFKDPPDDRKFPVDFSFKGTNKLTYGVVNVYYRWADLEAVDMQNQFAFLEPPRFCVDQLPFFDKNEDFVLTLPTLVEVYKTDQLRFIPLEFKRVSRL